MATYTITKGQQYDIGGATIIFGHLCARYKADGTYDYGDLPGPIHQAEIEAAVKRVIATGQPETLDYHLSPEEVAKNRELLRQTGIHQARMERMMDSGDSVY